MTSPEIWSNTSSSSLMMRPSKALSRLKTGTFSTTGFWVESMSLSAMLPAVIMPYNSPVSVVMGKAETLLLA